MEQLCQDKSKIAIVGGGPSGIYCALTLLNKFKVHNFNNFEIDIFDKSQILRTILPTGNGRCNITNSIFDIDEFIDNYPRGKKFLKSLFAKHFNYDSLEFFKSIGVDCYTQDDGRIFPKENSAKFVKDKMLETLKKYKNVKLINKEILSFSDLSNYSHIVISAGSRNTEELIKSTQHELIPFKKALCALNIENFNFPQGISIKSLDGDFVTTNDGISGPLAFKISSLNAYREFPYSIQIRLFDVEDLKKEISHNTKKTIGSLVSKFVPKSFAHALIKNYDKKASEISKKELQEISTLEFKVISTALKGEIVNAGGVNLDQLSANCKSKIVDNLWFCGEILNIDGFCGGFNLQNCWSSAWVVANDIVGTIIKK